MLDLVLPLTCGGCGQPATRWCARCAAELTLRVGEPHLIGPRADPGVPVFALGRYRGARRQAIVALKEHGRADLVAPLAGALAAGLHRLLTWRIVQAPLTLVPAPTRRAAARRRGGDPVTRVAVAAVSGQRDLTVLAALRLTARARDSVGLDAAARQRNIAGRVVLRRARPPAGAAVLLVDDILTTGATACESVRVLHTAGIAVAGVLVIACA